MPLEMHQLWQLQSWIVLDFYMQLSNTRLARRLRLLVCGRDPCLWRIFRKADSEWESGYPGRQAPRRSSCCSVNSVGESNSAWRANRSNHSLPRPIVDQSRAPVRSGNKLVRLLNHQNFNTKSTRKVLNSASSESATRLYKIQSPAE